MKRDAASERQVQAAAPHRSTWLSANAGSGKTRVLTDRVARLLLDGVRPQHILCLTYTKAAASEMQNRLFRRLGEWAMLPDDRLRGQLASLGHEGAVEDEVLRTARRLFAGAIETPGGLKIQTIHSFCAGVLRRFPLEAGVSPQFTEMEDRAAELLRADIVERMAAGPQEALLRRVAAHFSGQTLDQLTAAVAGQGHAMAFGLDEAKLAEVLDLPKGYDAARLQGDVFLGGEADLLARVREVIAGGSATDVKNAARLTGLSMDLSALPELEGIFLTGGSAKEPFTAKIGSFPTKKMQVALGADLPALEDLMRRVESARDRRLALVAAERTRALYAFAAAFLPEYERAKQLRGWLDFDDLILRTRDLLTDPAVAAWVLFRLDGGIDHILVDEAQDTSPTQWDVIQTLAREFTSGEGARADKTRTIFVVGDKKQSIYSFQGADPREFDRMRADFAERLARTETPLQQLELAHSFRSSPAVLTLVDTVFEGRVEAGFTPEQRHIAFKSEMPGRVDLWPLVDKVDDKDERDWFDPVDQLGQNHHDVVLARRVAQQIKRMIEAKTPMPREIGHTGTYEGRPVEPGDFLILVRRRATIFNEIIRACKEAGLPIAGADRLKVGAELAVRDLAALLNFLAAPEDDLSLATALKSPLFGWDEQALFDLAHKRTHRHLWPALRERAAEYPATMAMLNDLRGQTDFLRPYDLIERILTRHDGRRKLLARLGEEAEDGIDALLDQALSYERSAVPSLTGFLVWMETDELEIKRQLDSAGNRIRVMTVHGSKGLEAPIVILPDTGVRRDKGPGLMMRQGEQRLWSLPAAEMPAPMRAMREAVLEAERQEQDRLLYVALTRAEVWLIAAAAGDLGKSGDTWYDRIGAGLQALDAQPLEAPGGAGLRLERGDWASLVAGEREVRTVETLDLPAHFTTPAAAPVRPLGTISPSELGGAKALPGEAGLDEEAAKRRGRQVHLLLEHLAGTEEATWTDATARLLASGPDAAGEAERVLLLGEAQRVLTAPALQPLFAKEALVEVPITAHLSEIDARIHGIIDRLIVTDGHVLAVDFKTNASVPDSVAQVPDGLLRQMGAYAAALAQVFPGREIDTALLWTRNATLMRLPQDLVARALVHAGPALTAERGDLTF
ncbi:double-strand break repair helicase AddA [Pseudooceanicola nanhaiensis]|uniref:double-strand break repair helicase AddA n=1 Tax=Pseudooceanicola nanhaiensis TaxID=375761 RepID=UPI001CD29C1C|nr:double-strand break repair helicase AddA [Pseudooceanicola nanhaiensis]MCA0920256.1 double-strand break repair helicase AddA [Pseudooceanicola nanhaiensis]